MKNEKDVLILAIESSCDETAAAVVKNGRTVLSNVINTQIAIHTEYGGVVPEIASRKHIENINPVIREALKEADVTLDDITAIGVTYGPGLVGALLVGVAEAKAIAFATDKPLVGVHHIEGHIAANYIENKELKPPFVALVVSGGHTHLVKVVDYGRYEIIGRTRDDAAGEAFDKVARAIGLGYPGGPKIDKIAKEGNPDAIVFPRAHVDDAPYDFSFSGIKSSVRDVVKLYARITKAYYESDVSEENIEKLGRQARILFDDELKNTQTEDEFLSALKEDISIYRNNNAKISSFNIQTANNTRYTKFNNREYASIELVYYIREGTQLRTSGTKFTLRRDNSGKWKILYWELVDSVDLS